VRNYFFFSRRLLEQNATHKTTFKSYGKKQEIKEVIIHTEKILMSEAWKEFFSKCWKISW